MSNRCSDRLPAGKTSSSPPATVHPDCNSAPSPPPPSSISCSAKPRASTSPPSAPHASSMDKPCNLSTSWTNCKVYCVLLAVLLGQQPWRHHFAEAARSRREILPLVRVVLQTSNPGGGQMFNRNIGVREQPNQIMHTRIVANEHHAGSGVGQTADDARQRGSAGAVDVWFNSERRRESTAGRDQLRRFQ